MKIKVSLLAMLAMVSVGCTGCRDAYEVREELQGRYPDSEVFNFHGTDIWIIRLPNGAILTQDGAMDTPKPAALRPVQIMAPITVEDFDPDYQPSKLEL